MCAWCVQHSYVSCNAGAAHTVPTTNNDLNHNQQQDPVGVGALAACSMLDSSASASKTQNTELRAVVDGLVVGSGCWLGARSRFAFYKFSMHTVLRLCC
jgi:hypothetical protein